MLETSILLVAFEGANCSKVKLTKNQQTACDFRTCVEDQTQRAGKSVCRTERARCKWNRG